MKNLGVLFIFFSTVKFVCLQEITESSGESLTSTSSISYSTDFLSSETISSGEGPAIITILEDIDSITNVNNGTDFADGAIFNNDELQSINETLNTTTQSTTLILVEEITTTPSTTTMQTTTMPSTTSTTTQMTRPETTTTSPLTTTTMPPTTTTSTAVTSTTTSTIKITTEETTQRPTTTTTVTTRKTTKVTPVTVPITKPHESQEEGKTPCEFIEKDLMCDVKLSCFGEGTVDCTDVEEEEEVLAMVASKSSSSSSSLALEDADDYEDNESATIGFFPSELVGKIPPRFSFPWQMKSTDSNLPDLLTEAPVTVKKETSTATLPSLPLAPISTDSTTSLETMKLPSSQVTSTTLTERTFPPTSFQSTSSDMSKVTEEPTKIFDESTTTVAAENVTTTKLDNLSTQNLDDMTTASILINRLMTGTDPISTEYNNNEDSHILKSISSTEIRRKRDSDKRPSSSESLKLTVQDTTKQEKSCKITGNLYCIPKPSTVFCKGKGTCKVISVEKTEKSTNFTKGVENWAIAVIAICATAAALTIGLLVYLVVTSWKKLKVQPQNGVTTLNYVNSSPP